jgi:hypothetical protein
MRPSLKDQLAPIRASLGPVRFWCDGKQQHPSKGSAEAHARQLQRRFGADVATYRCNTCQKWHVGRVRRRTS